jgi:ribosome-binding protein aMBF1 (putative translation factor)
MRSGPLSANQIARDQEIRRKVLTEFPPLESLHKSPVLSEPLKTAIAESGKSLRRLAKEANVSAIVLAQFVAGQRDLRLATAEKLAKALGLKLVAS